MDGCQKCLDLFTDDLVRRHAYHQGVFDCWMLRVLDWCRVDALLELRIVAGCLRTPELGCRCPRHTAYCDLGGQPLVGLVCYLCSLRAPRPAGLRYQGAIGSLSLICCLYSAHCLRAVHPSDLCALGLFLRLTPKLMSSHGVLKLFRFATHFHPAESLLYPPLLHSLRSPCLPRLRLAVGLHLLLFGVRR